MARQYNLWNADGEKWCSGCKQYKPVTAFPESWKTNRHVSCRVCRSKRDSAYRPTSKSKLREVRYGMSDQQYFQTLDDQHGKCAICGKTSKCLLAVDHDHKTGSIRALLCGNCNQAIGLANDDPELLRKMAGYLEQYLR